MDWGGYTALCMCLILIETCSPEELSDCNTADSIDGSLAQEPQQCDKSSSSSASKSSAGDTMALVPYNEASIPILFKPHRQFTFLGHSLTISQDWGNGGVAAVVWDAAIVLCEFLTKHPDTVSGHHVLELGAGTGLVGMVAALAGGEVTSTERAEAMGYLNAAVSANLNPSEHHIKTAELDWTHSHKPPDTDYDVVLGADIVYIEDTFPDLLKTLLHFSGPNTQVLLSCRIRYERDSKFLLMMQDHFDVSKVYFDSQRDIHIYSAKRSGSSVT